MRDLEAEVHEVSPALLAHLPSVDERDVVLDDRDDVLLLRQPAERTVVRSAIHHDDLQGKAAGAPADAFDGRLEIGKAVQGTQDHADSFEFHAMESGWKDKMGSLDQIIE